MLCERAQELFSDYHEGAVKPAMLIPLESHLDECADCRTRLEGLRDIWTMLDSAPVVSPPPDFRAAVWARIDAAEAEKKRAKRPALAFDWRSLFRPATLGWAAAALAVIVLAPVVIPGGRTLAGPWFPWSLFLHAPSAASHVTVGAPQVSIQDGKRTIDVQVSNNGTSAAQVEVKVEGSPTPVMIVAPGGTSSWYHVAPAPAGSAHVTATWQDAGSQVTQQYTITQ